MADCAFTPLTPTAFLDGAAHVCGETSTGRIQKHRSRSPASDPSADRLGVVG